MVSFAAGMPFDALPELVNDFVHGRTGGDELLREVRRHVGRVSRAYPDGYFALCQKTPDAVEDLGNRVFSICARVAKGRFPFLGREPFVAFVEEEFDGRTIRYHSFYAKLSITRELLRADYAHNLSGHPRLRWRAELYRKVGDALREVGEAGGGMPPRWRRRGGALTRIESPERVVARLREAATEDLRVLTALALETAGPCTQARLTGLIEEAVGGPNVDEEAAAWTPPDPGTMGAVRGAVARAWAALDADDRALLDGLAEGLSYDELAERHPRFAHKVAVHRAVQRVVAGFVAEVAGAAGGSARTTVPVGQLAELVLDVLAEIRPDARGAAGVTAGIPSP